MKREIIFPRPLQPGDRIAIISPATTVKREYVEGGKALLERTGFEVNIAPHALGPSAGSYAASDQNRTLDLLTVISDPEIRAIYCARGGYGCIHLLPHIPEESVRMNPKWMIGFSDVSALHAFWHHCGVASIHGPMVKHLTELSDTDPCSRMLLDILTGKGSDHEDYTIKVKPHPLDITGKATGRIIGGNLAVLDGLAATPFDLLNVKEGEDTILFIEDIAEPIYKVERMLTRLYLSGTLSRVKGLIVGQFTEYKPDSNFQSMEEMISTRLYQWRIQGIPVKFGFPAGHTDENMPIVEGAMANLNVETGQSVLSYKLS